jgi:HEPN superfamily RiboL-PSP-like protein
MFNELRNEVLSRLVDVDRFSKQTCSPDGDRLAAVAKGLAFVHMYAAYEHCFCGSVQAGILTLNGMAIPHCDVRRELLSLTMDARINSAIDSDKTRNKWANRFALFEYLFSNEPAEVTIGLIPGNYEHYKYAHLQIVWRAFGLPLPVLPEPRLMGFVDEMVDHRNAVAHGRKTPYEVGRGYTAGDIDDRVKFTETVCLHLIAAVEQHFADAQNLKQPVGPPP